MLAELSDSIQLALTGLLVVWPSKPAVCTCSGAGQCSGLQDSLTFCQKAARECRSRVHFSDFWLGFLCGLVVALVALAFDCFLQPLFARSSSPAAAPERVPQAQRAREPAAAVVEIQPATPARLRALGLACPVVYYAYFGCARAAGIGGFLQ